MFGLDESIASLGEGATFAVICLVAVALGLRHATDPDHLTAVTTLVASGDEQGARGARRLGLSWGAGHATTLIVFGVPIVLSAAYLPESLQSAAEALVGFVIVALAVRLLRRWRSGALGSAAGARTRTQAYGIGLVHGMGGSAGVGLLLLAPIRNHAEALVALGLFASFTAISMSIASASFVLVLSRKTVAAHYLAVVPVLGAASLAFGCWYAANALPHIF
jgi:hypothetical protein